MTTTDANQSPGSVVTLADAQIKNAVMPSELQELKQAVNALRDRCDALEEVVLKRRKG